MQLWTTPRRVDVDPWAVTRLHDESYSLPHMDDKPNDTAPAHGTECCADTGDGPEDDFAFARGLLLAIAVTAVLASIVVVLL